MIIAMLIAMLICFLISFIFGKIANGKGATDNIIWFLLFMVLGLVLFCLSFALLVCEHIQGL